MGRMKTHGGARGGDASAASASSAAAVRAIANVMEPVVATPFALLADVLPHCNDQTWPESAKGYELSHWGDMLDHFDAFLHAYVRAHPELAEESPSSSSSTTHATTTTTSSPPPPPPP
eukprot:CAMPEP_0119200116 /NCGR_PEP_ID=MMETSP1316-20130426/24985_1 /TAXON_ID=41880 /ORGANISM="Pycnococcus provasolii, Strain RCC2336" /LENGTH=117 /DNA_ID=CAMNT_0007196151 /DNA_START=67 /DNA_END=417 /DNA_ORIENTATION=-